MYVAAAAAAPLYCFCIGCTELAAGTPAAASPGVVIAQDHRF